MLMTMMMMMLLIFRAVSVFSCVVRTHGTKFVIRN